MIFLNLYFNQFHTLSSDTYPLHFTNVSLMTLADSRLMNENGLIATNANCVGLNMDLSNDLLLNGVLCYFSFRVLFILNQLTAVQQSIEAISQFIGDRQPLIEGQPVPFTWTFL